MSASRTLMSVAGLVTAVVLGTPLLAERQSTEDGRTGTLVQAMEKDVTVVLPVTGLTSEQQQKALEAVKALSVEAYVCPHCKGRQSEPGTCVECKQELRREQVRVVLRAEVLDPRDDMSEERLIAVAVVPGEQLKLSQVEAALKAEDVAVERDALELSGAPVLVFRGAGSKDDVAGLESALRETKLFKDVMASFDGESSEAHVTVQIAKAPPKLMAVARVGDELEQRMRLVDVIWSAPYAKPVAASSPSGG